MADFTGKTSTNTKANSLQSRTEMLVSVTPSAAAAFPPTVSELRVEGGSDHVTAGGAEL